MMVIKINTCYLSMKNMQIKCKGVIKQRFTGGDEAMLCTAHWSAVKNTLKEMGD